MKAKRKRGSVFNMLGEPTLSESLSAASQESSEGDYCTPKDQMIIPKSDLEQQQLLHNQRRLSRSSGGVRLPVSMMSNPYGGGVEQREREVKRQRILSLDEESPGQQPQQQGLLRDRFEVLNVIGKGDYADVKLCKKKLDGCLYAVKILRESVNSVFGMAFALQEVWALSAVITRGGKNARYVIKYFDAWIEGQNQLHIQLEYCGGGDLKTNYLNPQSRTNLSRMGIFQVLKQMAKALEAIHALNISHLDVSPKNILQVAQGELEFRLNDFGRAFGTKRSETKGVFPEDGDPKYLCPVFAQSDEVTRISLVEKVDIFALGVTVLELAQGEPFNQPITDSKELEGIIFGNQSRASSMLDSDLKLILKRMISRDPAERPSAKELVCQLKELKRNTN